MQKLVEAVAREGETFEPEGMARLGPDRIFVCRRAGTPR
jgi:hypothetical protein